MTLESLMAGSPSSSTSSMSPDVGVGSLPPVGQAPSGVNVNALGQGEFSSRDYVASNTQPDEVDLQATPDPSSLSSPPEGVSHEFLGGRFKSAEEMERYVQELELKEIERSNQTLSQGYQRVDSFIPAERLPEVNGLLQQVGFQGDVQEAYNLMQDGIKFRAQTQKSQITQAQEKMQAILKSEFGAEYAELMPEIQRRIETTNPEKNTLKGARELAAIIKYEQYRNGTATPQVQKVPGARSLSQSPSGPAQLSEKKISDLYDSDIAEYRRLKPEIDKAYLEGRVLRDLR